MADMNIAEQGITEIPDVPANVKHLDANSNRLTTLGDSLKSGTGLEVLEVYANKIKTIGAGVFPALTNLTTINAFNNVMMKLPPDIGELSNLEEVNFSANKLMMLTDAHFTNWATVKILNLYDNNLIRLGSLAPLVALEELRLYGNQLEALPTLGKHEKLTTYEIHKNRIATIPDDYFTATPALENMALHAQADGVLSAVPPSILTCSKLLRLQLQENKSLTALPEGSWPDSLETLFIQETSVKSLPAGLAGCKNLKRVNVSKCALDGDADALADKLKDIAIGKEGGMFWNKAGQQFTK